jgi:hypothetical protein
MLSRRVFREPTPPGGVYPSEQSGRWGPTELLIGMPVPGSIALTGHWGLQEVLSCERVLGSTALTGCGGPQELLSGERVPGSNCLAA